MIISLVAVFFGIGMIIVLSSAKLWYSARASLELGDAN